MDAKPLPRPPAENVPESQATERTTDIGEITPPMFIPLYVHDLIKVDVTPEWLDAARRFKLIYYRHEEEIRNAIIEHGPIDDINAYEREIAQGNKGAAAVFLATIHDVAARSDDAGRYRLKPIIGSLGLDFQTELKLEVECACLQSREPHRRIFETALGLWESGRAIPNGEPQQSTETANPVKAKPERRRRTGWPQQAQQKVAEIWQAWRQRRNTTKIGGREIDCFESHKATLPECIKTVKDFHACKESARKNGLIPKYNRKRRKSAG
jgi:hypothetical protein